MTEAEFVSFISVGYALERVDCLRANHHLEKWGRFRQGDPPIREPLLKEIRKSDRHCDLLGSLLEECHHSSSVPASIAEQVESRNGEIETRSQRQILREQIRNSVATARFYGTLQAVIDERGLPTHIDDEHVCSTLESIRADECDSALQLYSLLGSTDDEPTVTEGAIEG